MMIKPWGDITPESTNLKDIMLEEATKKNRKIIRKFNVENFLYGTEEAFCRQASQIFDNKVSNISRFDIDNVQQDEDYYYSVENNTPDEILQHSDEMINKYDIILKRREYCYGTFDGIPKYELSDIECNAINATMNSLKTNLKNKNRTRKSQQDDKEGLEITLDYFTKLNIYKLISNQFIKRVNKIIALGKDAIIMHANGNLNCQNSSSPNECVLKVHKSLKKRTFLAENEANILLKMEKAKIPCPRLIAVKGSVILMSFIGENNCPALNLSSPKMKTEDYCLAYDQLVHIMKNLYRESRLVHGDLSEFNVLWHNKQCYLIDVCQSMEPTTYEAFKLLFKDCESVTKFFSKKKVKDVKSATELFEEVTGFDYYNRIILEATLTFNKNQI